MVSRSSPPRQRCRRSSAVARRAVAPQELPERIREDRGVSADPDGAVNARRLCRGGLCHRSPSGIEGPVAWQPARTTAVRARRHWRGGPIRDRCSSLTSECAASLTAGEWTATARRHARGRLIRQRCFSRHEEDLSRCCPPGRPLSAPSGTDAAGCDVQDRSLYEWNLWQRCPPGRGVTAWMALPRRADGLRIAPSSAEKVGVGCRRGSRRPLEGGFAILTGRLVELPAGGQDGAAGAVAGSSSEVLC
jgi:hypothetical protein